MDRSKHLKSEAHLNSVDKAGVSNMDGDTEVHKGQSIVTCRDSFLLSSFCPFGCGLANGPSWPRVPAKPTPKTFQLIN